MNKKDLRLLIIRIVLGCLILLNLFAIFRFSSQTGTVSEQTSAQISDIVADAVVDDYQEKDEPEKIEIRKSFDLMVRKTAHLLEFGALGSLIFLLLLTWKIHLGFQYAGALFSVLIVAVIDEMLLQGAVDGRAALWQDVLIDLIGAAVCCTVILLIVLLARVFKKLKMGAH